MNNEIDIIARGYVTYEDFGAVGDGVTDDFGAMREAHLYANEKGLPVLGNPEKNYCIFDTSLGTDKIFAIEIKTDTDWQGAKITIDDRQLTTMPGGPYYTMAKRHVFEVLPNDDVAMFKITDEKKLLEIAPNGIHPDTKKIDLGIDYNGRVMIIPYSSYNKVFRRRGYGQFAGADTHEIIVLEADGTVSKETPIIFHYDKVDYIQVYKLDPEHAITLKNGNFVTLDTRVNHKIDGVWKGGYIFRGINVTRSHTTLENLTHKVEGAFTLADRVNGIEGSTTGGFFCANYTSNVTLKDCVIPARFSFVGSSTYNFNAAHVNKIVLQNCYQPNFWVTVDPETLEIKEATEYVPGIIGNARRTSPDAILSINAYYINGEKYNLYYGFCGTNYCKNLEYIDSTLSRMDAHAALYNGKVINTNIADLELTGYGTFTFEDSNFHHSLVVGISTPLIFLRSDYGYTWEGDINIKNVNVYTQDENLLTIAAHSYSNWYYGYTCAFPNLTLDNVNYFSLKTEEPREPDYKVRFMPFRSYQEKMHLYDAGVRCFLGLVDEDGDGYIDEPQFDLNRDGKVDEKDKIDLDGDGKIGNTCLKMSDYADLDLQTKRRGIQHPTCTVNVNPIRPPRCIKIVNNKNADGTYKCNYTLHDTTGVSDGAWYRSESEPDTMGGFFGATEFITDDGSFIGTSKDQKVTKTFFFKEEYDV
ncbi:MAG: hypothetical protein E7612_02925 [Ruminococcaceae bacterium]|nr:hypothetical protein [Oscillospiraceae bacterium]